MSIIEAIKSGRPFRRQGGSWLRKAPFGNFWEHLSSEGKWAQTSFIVPDAIVADDWEIQEPSVTITRTEFYKAAQELFGFTIKGEGISSIWEYRGGDTSILGKLMLFAIKLGLGDP